MSVATDGRHAAATLNSGFVTRRTVTDACVTTRIMTFEDRGGVVYPHESIDRREVIKASTTLCLSAQRMQAWCVTVRNARRRAGFFDATGVLPTAWRWLCLRHCSEDRYEYRKRLMSRLSWSVRFAAYHKAGGRLRRAFVR